MPCRDTNEEKGREGKRERELDYASLVCVSEPKRDLSMRGWASAAKRARGKKPRKVAK